MLARVQLTAFLLLLLGYVLSGRAAVRVWQTDLSLWRHTPRLLIGWG